MVKQKVWFGVAVFEKNDLHVKRVALVKAANKEEAAREAGAVDEPNKKVAEVKYADVQRTALL